MWFLGSLILVILFFCISLLTGYLFEFLPNIKRNKVTAETIISRLILGWGIISLLCVISTYSGLKIKHVGPLIVVALVVGTAIAIFTNKKNTETRLFVLSPTSMSLFLIGIVGFMLSLLPILCFHAYLPFNDTWEYLCSGDYYYNHSFFDPISENITFSPCLQSITCLKGFLRIGSIILLSFAKSVSAVSRVSELYPALTTWGVLLNVLGIYLGARWILFLPRIACLACAALAAITVNPIFFASHNGFLPQTIGTAFAMYSLCVFSRILRGHNRDLSKIVILALSLAALLCAYADFLPVIVLAMILSVALVFIFCRKRFLYLFKSMLTVAALAIIFSLYDAARLIPYIHRQMAGVVGWHIPFSVRQFVGFALGVQPFDDSMLPVFVLRAIHIATYFFFVLFILGLVTRIRTRARVAIVYFSILTVLAAMLLYYSLFVKDPWITSQYGQTWSILKITNWAFPYCILAVGAGLVTMVQASKFKRILWPSICSFLFVVLVAELPIHYLTDQNLINPILNVTASQSPFNAYQQFGEMVNRLAPNQKIEMRIPNIKHREMLAYYLYPKPVICDWSDDCYVQSTLLSNNDKLKVIEKEPVIWVVSEKPINSHTSTPLPAHVIFSQLSRSEYKDNYYAESITNWRDGWYDVEKNAGHEWHWTSGKGVIEIDSTYAKHPVDLQFYCFTNGIKKIISIYKLTDAGLSLQNKFMADPQGDKKTLPIILNKGKNIYMFSADRSIIPIANDPRSLSFRIDNLTVTSPLK